MDTGRLDDWLAAYRRAWEEADTPAVLGLFTEDAGYRSHPLRPVNAGHDAIAAYWTRATADQRDVRVRFGDPVVDGDRVAVEWWATMTADGDPVTLVGCLLLTFAPDGRCRDLRECWHEVEELVDPPADWGQLDVDGGDRPVRPRRPLPLRALPRPPPGSRWRPRLHPSGVRHRGRPGPPLRHPVRRWRLGRRRVVVHDP
jgi:ketosteroid isomerase-like protein